MSIINANSLSLAISKAVQQRQASTQDAEFYRTLREMQAVAAAHEEENDDNVDTASLGSTTALVSALQPVSIDKELLGEYNRFFFNGKRHFLPRMVHSVGSVSARLNYFFAFMRHCLQEGRHIARLESDSTALAEYIGSLASRYAEYADQAEQGKDAPVLQSVTETLISIMGGNKFYLRNSEVYNGGYDVVVRSSKRDVVLAGGQVGHQGLLPASKHELSYEEDKFEAYSCETNLKVVKAAEQIITELFGGGATATAAAPVEVTVPMTYNFTKLQSIFEREVGIKLPVEMLHNLTIVSPDKTDPANYVRATFVLAADPRIASKIRKDLERRASESSSPVADQLPTVLHMHTSAEAPEGKMLNRAIAGTLTFTLNKELASYICQSENPTAHPIETWYRIWSSQYLRAAGRQTKSKTGAVKHGRIRRSNIPRFALPLSRMEAVTETRRSVGMTVESTRANSDGLYLSTDGTLSCLPPVEERKNFKALEEFEAIGNELAELASKYGVSSTIFSESEVEAALVGISADEYAHGKKLTESLASFEGTLLSYDWDYGLKFYAGANGHTYCKREAGATKPHDLAIADLLGFNMAPEGAEPKTRSFSDAIHLATSPNPSDIEGTPADLYGDQVDPARFLRTGPFENIIALYCFYIHNDTEEGTRLPSAATLVANSMAHFGYKVLDKETPRGEGRSYVEYLTPEGIPHSNTSPAADKVLINNLVGVAVHGCSGKPGSFVYHQAMEEVSTGSFDQADFQAALEDNELYFMPSVSPTHHFARVYGTLGGYVLKQILDAVNGLSNATLNSTKTNAKVDYVFTMSTGDKVDSKAEMSRPAGGTAFGSVRPLSLMLGKYVPDYPAWEEKGKEAVRSIERDPSVDVEDIHFAGGSDKFAVFPHQLDTQRYLRKPKPPAFAVLDIRPGGGKTSIGIVDMAAITADMNETGKRVRPLVICPDGLIRNWCDDATGFGAANWNVIPINSGVLKRWGYDKLVDMIRRAPINTIVVVGMQFLCNNRMHVVFGSQVVEAGFNLELVKAIGFNYIIIDESHKLKKLTSMRHRMIKQLTTASFVEYLRIATGTLIADRVTDIAGQTALYSPTIFRDGELAAAISSRDDDEEGSFTINGERVDLWKVDTPQKARDRLGMYAAVITKAKKEWAFMLPSPIETFHAINFTSDNSEAKEREKDDLHRQLYDMVVAQSIEELEALVSSAKKKRSSLADDDGEDDDDEPEEEEGQEEEGGSTEFSDGDELGMLNEQLVKAYLQRIERLIIAPEKDPAFETVFGAAGVTKYKSRKARYIAELVNRHFDLPNWEKGTLYSEYALVKHDGDTYLARKKDLGTVNRVPLDKSTVGVPPSENTEYWKKEPEGKIIIFCRYTNSVNAVYDALGAHQSQAVKFTGEEADKWSNLEAFKSDPKVKILVANEMGMSEGHNLQMASRIIRVESPWGPGELDQSASRIFRPDPAGAAAGEIYREVVFLDWVLADNTMEVPKMCRLIAKVFDAARFDEAYNPQFDSVLSNHLPEVSLSIENTLRVRSALTDYTEYTECYSQLNGVRNNEFHEMRATQPSSMIPVPPTPPIPGSAIMETLPFIPSQKIADPTGVKPVPLAAYLRDPAHESYVKEPDTLVGLPVITDHGKGMIIGVNKRTRVVLDVDGNKVKDSYGKIVRVVDEKNPISSLRVRIKGLEEPITLSSTGLAFVPTKLKAKDRDAHYAVDLLYRQADLRKRAREQQRIDELNAAAEKLEREEEERQANRERKLRVRIKDKKDAVVEGKQRKSNVVSGQPINAGVKREAKPKVNSGVGPMEATREPLVLSPAYYHGYLTLETDDLSYAKELKKLKFKEFGEYVFVEITRRNQANAVMDYIEENFHLSDATADRLGEVFGAFEKGKRGLYNLELAATKTLPHFFTVRRQMVKDRKEARLFPFFKDDVLMIACDLATCPVMKKHIGKDIPGAATKWKLSSGALMNFVQNKTELNALVKSVESSGIVIANKPQLKSEIAAINFRSKRK